MGRRYLIEHVMMCVRKQEEEKAYRVYMAEALRVAANNSAGQEERMLMKMHYLDIVTPTKATKEADADEIINNIKNKLGGSQ